MVVAGNILELQGRLSSLKNFNPFLKRLAKECADDESHDCCGNAT